MNIYIAKHYWKDKENATWEYHSKVKKLYEEYLSKDYYKFVADKPSMIRKDKYYIYPCYEDTKDVFGRNITNITFYIATKKLREDVCHRPYKNLTISDNKNIILMAVSLVLAGLIILSYFLNQSPIVVDEKEIPKKIALSKDKDKVSNVTRIEAKAQIENDFEKFKAEIEESDLSVAMNKLKENWSEKYNAMEKATICKIIKSKTELAMQNLLKNDTLVNNYQEYEKLHGIVLEIKILKEKIMRVDIECKISLTKNNETRIEAYENREKEYRNVLTDGVNAEEVHLWLHDGSTPTSGFRFGKDERGLEIDGTAYKCEVDKNCTIISKTNNKTFAEKHYVLYLTQKGGVFTSSEKINSNMVIDKNDLIRLYNGEVIDKKIDDRYLLHLRKKISLDKNKRRQHDKETQNR